MKPEEEQQCLDKKIVTFDVEEPEIKTILSFDEHGDESIIAIDEIENFLMSPRTPHSSNWSSTPVTIDELYKTDVYKTAGQEKEDEEQEKHCTKVFNVFDTNGDGTLDKEEFMKAVKNLEIDIGFEKIEKIFDELDYNQSGHIDLAEFLEGIRKMERIPPPLPNGAPVISTSQSQIITSANPKQPNFFSKFTSAVGALFLATPKVVSPGKENFEPKEHTIMFGKNKDEEEKMHAGIKFHLPFNVLEEEFWAEWKVKQILSDGWIAKDENMFTGMKIVSVDGEAISKDNYQDIEHKIRDRNSNRNDCEIVFRLEDKTVEDKRKEANEKKEKHAKLSRKANLGFNIVVTLVFVGVAVALALNYKTLITIERANFLLISFALLCGASVTFFRPLQLEQGFMYQMQFRWAVYGGIVMSLNGVYSDVCSLVIYITDGETQQVIIFIAVFILCRIISLIWLWTNFHSRNLLWISGSEFLPLYEAFRTYSEKNLLKRKNRLSQFSTIIESIPMMMIHISYINKQEKLTELQYSIVLALCLHIFQIASSIHGFDALQSEKTGWASHPVDSLAQWGFRLMETLSRVGALMMLHLVLSGLSEYLFWSLLIYLILEVMICFAVQRYFLETDYGVALRYAFLWVLNIPELSKKTLGQHWACVEIKKQEEEQRKLLAGQFQKQFENVYEIEKNYKFACEKTFESFAPDKTKFDPFPIRPTWAGPYKSFYCIWDLPFIGVCVFGRILNNAILIGICYSFLQVESEDFKKILLWTSVVGTVMCPICLWRIYPKIMKDMGFYVKERNECIRVEDLFELDGAVNKAHVENFVVLGKDLNGLTNDGELLTTISVRHNNIQAMDILLHAGIDINKADSRGYTPLMVAVMLGNKRMIDLMLEYRHEECCCTPLFDTEEYKVNIDKKLPGGYEGSALIYTAPSCDVEILDLLAVKNEANVNIEGTLGNVLATCFDTEIEVDKDVEGAMENGKPIPYLRYEDLKKKPDYIKKCIKLEVNPNLYRTLEGMAFLGKKTLLWRAINLNKSWFVHLLLDEYKDNIKVTNFGEERNEEWVGDASEEKNEEFVKKASHLYIHTPDYVDIAHFRILRRFMDVGCDFIKNNEDVVTDEDAFCSSPFYNSLYSSPKHDPKYLEDLEWFLKEIMTTEIKQYLEHEEMEGWEIEMDGFDKKFKNDVMEIWHKYGLYPGEEPKDPEEDIKEEEDAKDQSEEAKLLEREEIDDIIELSEEEGDGILVDENEHEFSEPIPSFDEFSNPSEIIGNEENENWSIEV